MNALEIGGYQDLPLMVAAVVLSAAANIAARFISKAGRLSTIERKASIAYQLNEIGGMDSEVESLKEQIKASFSRIERTNRGMRVFTASLRSRMGELFVSTVIASAVYSIIAFFTGAEKGILVFIVVAFLVGLAMHAAFALYEALKKGGSKTPNEYASIISTASSTSTATENNLSNAANKSIVYLLRENEDGMPESGEDDADGNEPHDEKPDESKYIESVHEDILP